MTIFQYVVHHIVWQSFSYAKCSESIFFFVVATYASTVCRYPYVATAIFHKCANAIRAQSALRIVAIDIAFEFTCRWSIFPYTITHGSNPYCTIVGFEDIENPVKSSFVYSHKLFLSCISTIESVA